MPPALANTVVTLKAGCKINLFLKISGVREDGYHELDTLFYPVPEPFDTLTITRTEHDGFSFSCDRSDLENEKNIVVKAYRAFCAATGYSPNCHVHLEKGIPDGAGLGGGSSDAAALLQWLNTQAAQHNAALTDDALIQLAAGIGADVPFFLYNTPCRATGIGDQLVPVNISLAGYTLLLVCPPVTVNTAWAYTTWDAQWEKYNSEKNCTSRLTSNRHAVKSSTSRALWLFNSFESAVFPVFPELRLYKEQLLAHGAAGALMSGSGSSLFALYRDLEMACNAKKVLDTMSAATYIHRL